MAKALFRKEALDAQRDKFLGELTVARPLSLWLLTLLAVALAAMLISVTVWGQYQRRERVQGFLASEIGSVPMLISDAGQVKEIDVQEGEQVSAGQPLAHVTIDRTTSSAASSSDKVLEEIGRRRAILAQERDETIALGEHEIEQVHKRIADLRNEIAALDGEINLQKQRLKSSRDVEARYEGLSKDHFISDVGVQQKRDDVTDQELKLATLARERASLQKDLGAAQLDEPSMRLRTTTQVEQIARQLSELAQTSTEESLLGEFEHNIGREVDLLLKKDHSRADSLAFARPKRITVGVPWPGINAPLVSMTCVKSIVGINCVINFLPNSRLIKELAVICPV